MKKILPALFVLITVALAYAAPPFMYTNKGNVSGPSSSTDNRVVCWDGTTAQDLKDCTSSATIPGLTSTGTFTGTSGVFSGSVTAAGVSSSATVTASGLVSSSGNSITISDYVFLPINWCRDGTVPPDATETITSTNSASVRQFSGTANQDVQCNWAIPLDAFGGTVTARVIGFVTNATAPANGEVVAFSIAGASVGDSELLSSAVGSAQTASFTADATYAQYDRRATAFSSAITVTGMAAGETALFKVTRLATTTDTYAQKFGVWGIELKFTRVLQ